MGESLSRTDDRRPLAQDPSRQRAQELHEQGMPFQMAMAVAYGRLKLSDALERMAVQDRAEKLMESHGLTRALAVQVAMGHADLDAILMRRRMEEYVVVAPLRSCLAEVLESREELALALHGHRSVRGHVTEVDRYSITFVPMEKKGPGEPMEIRKLQIKFAYAPSQWKLVRKALKTDKAVKSKSADPIELPQDRYTCSTKRLFRYLDQQPAVQATLLEGEVLKGQVTWFSRYELGMEVKDGVEVTIFRHALHDLRSL